MSDKSGAVQVFLFLFSNLFSLLYITSCRPLDSQGANRLEILNQGSNVILTVNLLVFLDSSLLPQMKIFCGWIFIGIFSLNITINLIYLIYETVHSVILIVKKCRRYILYLIKKKKNYKKI